MADDTTKPGSLEEGKKLFSQCEDAASDNQTAYKDDTRFVRARDQWPADIAKQRQADGRPCLTIDKLGPVIRQVVNDSRQNKPSMKVHPVEGGDTETAEVINGLIRHIENASDADVAYDTAVECAVGGGFGYIRAGLDYAYDDSFDLDITIERVANPLCVYPDPHSTAADSSDWNVAFIVDRMPKEQFKRQYPEAVEVDWSSSAWSDAGSWLEGDEVLVAEWWSREPYEKTIVKTATGQVYDEKDLTEDPDLATLVAAGAIQVVEKRKTKCHRVTQRIMTGAEILSEREWPGSYIPIAPVYGDEYWLDGKRYLRSLINGAKDAQLMFNVWRTTGTELVGLAPRVPFIGPKNAFSADEGWDTVNTKSHPYLEYEGQVPPQRQPLDMGAAAGALQEALNASDDIKSITGIYDASLGARSNETSGRAIMARQREGDVSTFHFIDNLARGIRCLGRIIVDLIPSVYTTARIVRVIGEDGSQEAKPINQAYPVTDPKTGQPVTEQVPVPGGEPIEQVVMAIHDLTTGKYDLVVASGPSYTTKREEAAFNMTEMMRAFPPSAPVIGPILAKNLDWPGADEIAEKLEALVGGQQQIPPEVQKAIEEGKAEIERLTQENQQLKADQQTKVQTAQIDADAQREAALIDAETEKAVAQIKAAAQQQIAAMQAAFKARAEAQRPIVQAAPRPRQVA